MDLREGFQLGIGLSQLTHRGGKNTEAWHNSNLVKKAGREMGRDKGMRRDRDRKVANGDSMGFPEGFRKHDFDLLGSRESLLREAGVKEGSS